MKKYENKIITFVTLIIILISTTLFAVDIKVGWDTVPGANGYKIMMSQDAGVTWTPSIDLPPIPTTFTWISAPEDKFLIFKVCATNAAVTQCANWQGVWYDHRLKLLHPSGFGIAD